MSYLGEWKTSKGNFSVTKINISNSLFKYVFEHEEGKGAGDINQVFFLNSLSGYSFEGKIYPLPGRRHNQSILVFKFFMSLSDERNFSGSWDYQPGRLDRNGNYRNKWNGTKPLEIDGVFEGGGTLGSAYIGSLQLLQDNHIWFKTVVGNSAGAITAALIAAGYKANEMHWLSANYTLNQPPKPKRLDDLGITETISFSDFLDAPDSDGSSLRSTTREKSLLWKSLYVGQLDEIGDTKVTLYPTRKKVIKAFFPIIKPLYVAKKILGNPLDPQNLPDPSYASNKTDLQIFSDFENENDSLIDELLFFLKKEIPTLRELFNIDTSGIRTSLANEIWDKVYENSEKYRKLINILYEHGIYKGDAFLNKIDELLKVKNRGNEMLFRHLKIPLAVIAVDINTQEMIVYDQKNTPDFSVAEAVRQSMSVPLFFEPRRNYVVPDGAITLAKSGIIVDGGIASNYPNWIYLNGGVNHFHSEFVDASRIKIGFSVDDKAEANPIWAVDDVIEVSISDVLKKIWNGNSTTSSPITTELSGIVSKSIIGIVEAEINNAIDEFMYVQLLLESNRKEAYIAKMITSSLNKSDGKFYTVEIPVAQFNWLDFEINSDKEKLDGIAQRGWHATLEILREKRLLSVTTDNSQCPFSI